MHTWEERGGSTVRHPPLRAARGHTTCQDSPVVGVAPMPLLSAGQKISRLCPGASGAGPKRQRPAPQRNNSRNTRLCRRVGSACGQQCQGACTEDVPCQPCTRHAAGTCSTSVGNDLRFLRPPQCGFPPSIRPMASHAMALGVVAACPAGGARLSRKSRTRGAQASAVAPHGSATRRTASACALRSTRAVDGRVTSGAARSRGPLARRAGGSAVTASAASPVAAAVRWSGPMHCLVGTGATACCASCPPGNS